MNEKYPITSLRTSHDIYDAPQFEDDPEFMGNYNKLIHREIIKNNTLEVFLLCKRHYRDRAFPWYDEMLKVAINQSNYSTFMLVFYMWNFYYEERYSSLTYDEVLQLVIGSPEEKLKVEFMKEITNKFNCFCVKDFDIIRVGGVDEDAWDDILFDKTKEVNNGYHDLSVMKLKDLGIDFKTNYEFELNDQIKKMI